jgi:hypothetical protein
LARIGRNDHGRGQVDADCAEAFGHLLAGLDFSGALVSVT